MNVYVESNFVLEHALEQEECDSCIRLIRLASENQLRLVIPAFSLAEPHHAVSSKAKTRSRLGEDLRQHLGELGRSRAHRQIPTLFDALAASLIESAQLEREGVRRAVSELLETAEVISLDATVLRDASLVEDVYGLSGQDSIVLASVLLHLKRDAPIESCFLTRNTKDFDDPDIRELLMDSNCKFFGKFASALEYVVTRLN